MRVVKCFFTGCQTLITHPEEMCIGHWGVVPLPLRKTIVLLRGLPGHDEAIANAIHQVQERLHAGFPLASHGRNVRRRV